MLQYALSGSGGFQGGFSQTGSFLIRFTVFFQRPVVFMDHSGNINPHIPIMLGFTGKTGDLLFILGITQDEAVIPAVLE